MGVVCGGGRVWCGEYLGSSRIVATGAAGGGDYRDAGCGVYGVSQGLGNKLDRKGLASRYFGDKIAFAIRCEPNGIVFWGTECHRAVWHALPYSMP